MDKITLSYIAGFFDGEGSINISARKRKHFSLSHTLVISIGQKDGKTLDWIKDNLGGNIHQVKRDNSFMWYCSNRKAEKFLRQIYPYLKYKKPQAELALKFYDDRELKQITPILQIELDRRESIRQELKSLHKTIIKSQYVGSETKRIDPRGM